MQQSAVSLPYGNILYTWAVGSWSFQLRQNTSLCTKNSICTHNWINKDRTMEKTDDQCKLVFAALSSGKKGGWGGPASRETGRGATEKRHIHRTSGRLAGGKGPSWARFVGDGSFRGCPVCAHIPPHFLEYTYIVSTPSTVSSKITHSRQGPAAHEGQRGRLKVTFSR